MTSPLGRTVSNAWAGSAGKVAAIRVARAMPHCLVSIDLEYGRVRRPGALRRVGGRTYSTAAVMPDGGSHERCCKSGTSEERSALD